jgi:hypothetical protein
MIHVSLGFHIGYPIPHPVSGTFIFVLASMEMQMYGSSGNCNIAHEEQRYTDLLLALYRVQKYKRPGANCSESKQSKAKLPLQ